MYKPDLNPSSTMGWGVLKRKQEKRQKNYWDSVCSSKRPRGQIPQLSVLDIFLSLWSQYPGSSSLSYSQEKMDFQHCSPNYYKGQRQFLQSPINSYQSTGWDHNGTPFDTTPSLHLKYQRNADTTTPNLHFFNFMQWPDLSSQVWVWLSHSLLPKH